MSSMVRRGISLAVLLCAGPLRAAPPAEPARLVYTRGRGAERCPDEAAVRDAVRIRLGYDPFQPGAARTVTATIAARGKALRADVRLDDAHSRHLEAAPDDCDELVASVALAIAIAVDPQSQLRPPSPVAPQAPLPAPAPGDRGGAARTEGAGERTEPSPPPEPPSPPLPAPLPAALAPRLPDDPVRFRLGLAALAAAGSAPHATFGLALAGGLRRRWFSAVLEARADLPASTEAAAGGAVSGQVLALTLAPCFHRSFLVACALGTAGALRGAGSGVPNPKTDVTPFGAAGVRLGAEVPLGRVLSLAFSGDAAALLPRTALQLRGQDVWTTAPAEGTLRFGVVADFP